MSTIEEPTQFVEMQTADLLGPALDWAVAQAEAVSVWVADGQVRHLNRLSGSECLYDPSDNWNLAGPLADKYDVKMEKIGISGCQVGIRLKTAGWHAHYDTVEGETLTIALCRAVVQNQLGYALQIPTDLVPASH